MLQRISIIYFILFLFIFIQCSRSKTKNENISTQENVKDHVQTDSLILAVKTFQQDSGWGYDIYIDNKIYIHQPHIPAIQGLKSFTTESDAEKTGLFVSEKIQHHIMPPTITPEELDSLGVLN